MRTTITSSAPATVRPVGCVELLGRNGDFRELRLGQLISNAGDRFSCPVA